MLTKYFANIPGYINSYKYIAKVKRSMKSPRVLILGSGPSLLNLKEYPLSLLKRRLNIDYIFAVNNVCLCDFIDISLIDDYFLCYPLYFERKVSDKLRHQLTIGGDFTIDSIDSEIAECFAARDQIVAKFKGRLWIPSSSDVFNRGSFTSLVLPYSYSRRSSNTTNPLLPLNGPHSTTSCAIALARAYGASEVYTLGIDNNSFTTLEPSSSGYTYYYRHAYDKYSKKRIHSGLLSEFLFSAYKVNRTYELYKAIKITESFF